MIGDVPKPRPPDPAPKFVLTSLQISIVDPKTQKKHHVGELELGKDGFELCFDNCDWLFAAWELEALAAYVKRVEDAIDAELDV